MASRFDLNRYLDERLDKIGSTGTFLGRIVGNSGRTVSKILIGVGLLVIFGVAVFLWSFLQGMGKKK